MVVFSLFFQILLIVMGNRRKYNPAAWLRLCIWSAYLLADWVATVALGALFKKQRASCSVPNSIADKTITINDELMAFWAPFLLLHLGGPDTITAYAIADNELWLRHLLGLGVQTGVALYITYMVWTWTWLSFLTIPLIFAGFIKYGERSLALMSANREQFLVSLLDSPDPGPNYAKFMEEFSLKMDEGFCVLADDQVVDHESSQSDVKNDQGNKSAAAPLEEVSLSHQSNIVQNDTARTRAESLEAAYKFFQSFKRLFVDLILGFEDRDNSQSHFLKSTWEDAFTLVEIELGFGYDAFYTKAPIIYTKMGCICRFITSSFTIIVFVFFLFVEKHKQYEQTDVIITYILLFGAIILEFLAVILLLSSDRTKLWWSKHKHQFHRKIFSFVPMANLIIPCSFKPRVPRKTISPLISCFGNIASSFLPYNKKRWSNSLSQYNLLRLSLKRNFVPFQDYKCVQKILKYLPIHETLDKFSREDRCEISSHMKKFIFQHFLKKSKKLIEKAEVKKENTQVKKEKTEVEKEKAEVNKEKTEVEKEKAEVNEEKTEVEKEKAEVNKEKTEIKQEKAEIKKEKTEIKKEKAEVKKEKSEYDKSIASLCSARGGLVFEEYGDEYSSKFGWSTDVEFDQSILIWHIATDLCYQKDVDEDFLAAKDSSKNLSDYMLYLLVMRPFMLPIGIGMIRFRDTCKEAKQFSKERAISSKGDEKLRRMLLRVCTEVEPTKVKGDRSKSVLFDGCLLANQLQKLVDKEKWDKEKKWEFICNVWIEILGYAASHCKGYFHAQQLARGGELLTHVWLLMAHLGITEQFQINRGHARAKLALK
jgi:hypothetical protein